MTDLTPETLFFLRLSMLRGIGPATLKKISLLPGSTSLDVSELARSLPTVARALREPDAWDAARMMADRQIAAASKNKTHIISSLDPFYPENLRLSKDDPFILYVKGRYPLPPAPIVAVIGTRVPTEHGKLIAHKITKHFAAQDVSILSGLALGCDSIAHQSTIASSGHTIAVLAHGLQTVAPSSNKGLALEILESGGTLISEYRFGVEPRPTHFVQRDRTQAGIAEGVILIQSDKKGGSVHASRAALAYGRWLAVAYPTAADIRTCEPKIQANLILSSDDLSSKVSLLGSDAADRLDRVIILRSRDDYSLCPLKTSNMINDRQDYPPTQLSVPL